MRTKEWTRDEILNLINTNDEITKRAIIQLYNRQTLSEKKVQAALLHNKQGFNHADSKFLSSLAEQINKNRVLSNKQLFVARKRLQKYANQLTNIANEKLKQMIS